jgi:beta-galactosidase
MICLFPVRVPLKPTMMNPHPILIALLLVPVVAPHAATISFETREFQSLDGRWQIVFDRDNEGGAKQWVREKDFPRERQREIAVPSCWELIEQDYEGVAFYRRTFEVPQSWRGKVVRLQFDAGNFRAEVWLNDTAVGLHEGGFKPFEFRVDELLKFDGANTLILRVVGPILMQNKRVDDLGPMETPPWRGALTGGIWQPVRLIGTGDVHVKDVFIEPRPFDDSATVHTELEHGGEKAVFAQVEITIRSRDQTVA